MRDQVKGATIPMILWAGDSGCVNTAFDVAAGIEPAPACAGEPHADRYSLFGENVEKNISRSGMRRTAFENL